MSYDEKDLRTYSKDQLAELLTSDIAGWNKLFQEARRASGYSWGANLASADLRGANLASANLASANLASADLWGANLGGANLGSANLASANLAGADLASADLASADLAGANLASADLWSANLNGEPITVESWCDLLDLPRCGNKLRIAYKRLPKDRITGRNQNQGKNLIEWEPGRWVEAPDWNESESCGGGLHLSPSAYATRAYSSEPLVIVVAFDPKEAVLLGDKVKVRRAKVVG